MRDSLTPSQAQVLKQYKDFMARHGRAPSIREVAVALEKEPGNIHYHIKNLERQGHLVRTGGHRGVRLVNRETKLVPLIGVVACGEPITIFEETEEEVSVPETFLRNGYGHYALRAKGDSMVKAHIRNGDILVIRQQEDVNDGEIGVVVTGEPPFEGVTLKTIYHRNQSLLLKPENDDLEPYVVKKGEVRGKLVGVMRHFDED